MPLHFESYEIHTAGVVVSSYTEKHSHWQAASSLDDWLKKNNVSGIYDIDTRQLTQIIREKVISSLSFFKSTLFLMETTGNDAGKDCCRYRTSIL